MPEFQVVTREAFADKRWQRCKSYDFTSRDAVAPLTAQELPLAALAVPVAFIKSGDEFTLVALQGLEPNSNLFLSPKGAWRAAYVPECYRCYPFLVATDANSNQVLCFNVDSGLVSETGEGELFFDADGKPNGELTEALKFLGRNANNRLITARLCKLLHSMDLIQPWPISLDPITEGEKARNVEGLYCIDEKRFNSLGDDAFLELRKAGLLPVIYCQMLSMAHLNTLVKLQKLDRKLADSKMPKSVELPKELEFDLSSGAGTVHFDNL